MQTIRRRGSAAASAARGAAKRRRSRAGPARRRRPGGIVGAGVSWEIPLARSLCAETSCSARPHAPAIGSRNSCRGLGRRSPRSPAGRLRWARRRWRRSAASRPGRGPAGPCLSSSSCLYSSMFWNRRPSGSTSAASTAGPFRYRTRAAVDDHRLALADAAVVVAPAADDVEVLQGEARRIDLDVAARALGVAAGAWPVARGSSSRRECRARRPRHPRSASAAACRGCGRAPTPRAGSARSWCRWPSPSARRPSSARRRGGCPAAARPCGTPAPSTPGMP